jgi:hypothetical protein
MNRSQKVALFNLLTTVLALIACFVLSARMYLAGMSVIEAITPPSLLVGVAILALVLLTMSELVFFPKAKNQADYDERDKQIHLNALFIGAISFGVSILIMLMTVFYVKFLVTDFSPFLLPAIFLVGVAVHTITASTVTLIKYR